MTKATKASTPETERPKTEGPETAEPETAPPPDFAEMGVTDRFTQSTLLAVGIASIAGLAELTPEQLQGLHEGKALTGGTDDLAPSAAALIETGRLIDRAQEYLTKPEAETEAPPPALNARGDTGAPREQAGGKPFKAPPIPQPPRKKTPEEIRDERIARFTPIKGIAEKTAAALVDAGIPDPETLSDMTAEQLEAMSRKEATKAVAALIERGDLIARAKDWVTPKPRTR